MVGRSTPRSRAEQLAEWVVALVLPGLEAMAGARARGARSGMNQGSCKRSEEDDDGDDRTCEVDGRPPGRLGSDRHRQRRARRADLLRGVALRATATGTNPEELLGAAHASCFSMALTLFLERPATSRESVETDRDR